MSISPLSLTKYPTATVCEACRATGTSVPQLVLDKILKNRFKSVQYRHKLGVSHFELDEYIPEINLGIEYNGLWHDTEEVMIRDYNKQLICNQLNIPVLYINENGERKPPEIKNGSIEIWRHSTRSIEPYQFILDVIQNRFNIVLKPITDKELENALNSAYSIIKRDSVPNNITITHPDKAATWDYEKNGSLRPEMFTAGSGQRVYWKCTNCKIPHSYEKTIRHRCSRGQGCPVKAGQLVVAGVNDIGTTAQHLLKFWDYDKNSKIELKPEYISIGQNTQVFWKCPECEYRWFVSPNEFRSLKRCKSCKTPINRS